MVLITFPRNIEKLLNHNNVTTYANKNYFKFYEILTNPQDYHNNNINNPSVILIPKYSKKLKL